MDVTRELMVVEAEAPFISSREILFGGDISEQRKVRHPYS